MSLETNTGREFFTVIVRIDRDGSEQVIHGYKGRHFSSEKAALKSANGFIAKHALNG